MTKKEIKDKNFKAYNDNTKKLIKKFDNMWAREEDIDRAFKLLWNKSNAKVLELWCLNWREYWYIKKYTEDYKWIDISNEAINYANDKYRNDKFICSDLEEYNYENNYDIIFSFASLIHSDMETTIELFEKFYKSLNNWWIVYVSLKSSEKYEQIIKNDNFWERIFYHYSIEEYKKIWNKLFDIVYEDTQNENNQTRFTLAFKK